MKLPPGVDELSFKKALQEFSAVVGDDWVFSKDEDVALYNDAYTPFYGDPDRQRVASAALAPATVEQVQQIVRIANKYRTPLFTISTGRNLGYGGSAPNYSGSIIVDLKRMNRIIEVNATDGYMIVEPGVSFLDVRRYFDEHGIDYIPSSPAPGWGSPIGNALEHGAGNVFNDNFSAVTGLEVVLASGEVLRTGRGALPNSKLWANYHYGFGPYIDGMFSQSNFGIVTKACFWIKPRWEVTQMFMVASFNEEDLDTMADALKELRNHDVINMFGMGCPIRESANFRERLRFPNNPLIPEVRALHRQRDGGSTAQWQALAAKAGMPAASVIGIIRGPASIVKAHLDYVQDFLAKRKTPGAFVPFPPETVIKPPNIDFGMVALQKMTKGHYFFSPAIQQTREDLLGINLLIRNIFLDAGEEALLDEEGWWGTAPTSEKHMMVIMEWAVQDDKEKNNRMRELFLKVAKAAGERGWGEYRAPVAFHDNVMDQFSFNNHILRRFNETIYDALDPNGILSPGKSGIWPKHLRKA